MYGNKCDTPGTKASLFGAPLLLETNFSVDLFDFTHLRLYRLCVFILLCCSFGKLFILSKCILLRVQICSKYSSYILFVWAEKSLTSGYSKALPDWIQTSLTNFVVPIKLIFVFVSVLLCSDEITAHQ